MLLTLILLAPLVGLGLLIILPEREERLIRMTAALATGISLVFTSVVYFLYDIPQGGLQFSQELNWLPELGIRYSVGVDGLSLPLLLLAALVGFAAVFAAGEIKVRVKEFFIWLLLLIAGIFGVFIAQNLFFFYFFYDLVIIPSYLLIVVWGSTRKEYGAMKLTLYHVAGSALLLLGIIATVIYASRQLGEVTFDLTALSSVYYAAEFQKWVFLIMLLGLGVLVPLWPLHLWAPDGHVAAPTAISMLLAGVIMKLGGYGLMRLPLFFFPEAAHYWAPLIGGLCLVNVIYGAMVAMVQKDLKFVIGYSSVSHMGYVLLGVAALDSLSLVGAGAQMFAHGVMTALFFAMVGNIYARTHTRELARLGGLAHQMPRVAAGFLLAGLASLGLPGFYNFVAEFFIFTGAFTAQGAVHQGLIGFRALAVVAIAGIVITAIYVLLVVKRVFFGPPKEEWRALSDIRGMEMIPLLLLGSVLLLFGLCPSLQLKLIGSGVAPLVAKLKAVMAMGGRI
ncbi:complex I subunit 4 family protein [Desulfothermobacter acidiphilus]|uniref:complex I subunit 4 family protein n=1 Tax=Desulfothermobacter acidiphilus TaxID=1938353 RepID=UPI003F8C234F